MKHSIIQAWLLSLRFSIGRLPGRAGVPGTRTSNTTFGTLPASLGAPRSHSLRHRATGVGHPAAPAGSVRARAATPNRPFQPLTPSTSHNRRRHVGAPPAHLERVSLQRRVSPQRCAAAVGEPISEPNGHTSEEGCGVHDAGSHRVRSVCGAPGDGQGLQQARQRQDGQLPAHVRAAAATNCIAAATRLLHIRTACPPTATTTTLSAPAHPARRPPARPLPKGTSTSCGRSASR